MLRQRLNQIQYRKDFIKWLNSIVFSNCVDNEIFDYLSSKHGVNSIFETIANDGSLKKYVLLTVTKIPNKDSLKKIKESNAIVINRIRHYKVNGFSKTYCY